MTKMPDMLIDIVVESGKAGHFIVIKSDGHEIYRWEFPTANDANLYAMYAADVARSIALAKSGNCYNYLNPEIK